jgi:hypothetical protein
MFRTLSQGFTDQGDFITSQAELFLKKESNLYPTTLPDPSLIDPTTNGLGVWDPNTRQLNNKNVELKHLLTPITVNNTLIEDYNWEVAKDSPTTWRIGDGTAAFYNYIYATVAGFTENDSFRSNQVLEGIITREEALKRAEAENQPRYESLKWYCDTIGVDLEKAIKTINNIPKLY